MEIFRNIVTRVTVVLITCWYLSPPHLWRASIVWNCMVIMMTSSNGNIFRATDPLWGEFIGHRWIPPIKASDAELWCFLWPASEQTFFCKQSRGQWFETPSRPLWCHCNDVSNIAFEINRNCIEISNIIIGRVNKFIMALCFAYMD